MTQSIIDSIINRVNKTEYAAEYGYVTKHHPLYPDGYKEPFNYPYTTGGNIVPTLNIVTKEVFDELMKDNYNSTHVYQIGTLDFWDEYVEFFGSFDYNHALFTKLSLEELASYGLPEYFLRTVEIFKHPEENKWHMDSLTWGKSKSTVIVVLDNDEIKLYRYN